MAPITNSSSYVVSVNLKKKKFNLPTCPKSLSSPFIEQEAKRKIRHQDNISLIIIHI